MLLKHTFLDTYPLVGLSWGGFACFVKKNIYAITSKWSIMSAIAQHNDFTDDKRFAQTVNIIVYYHPLVRELYHIKRVFQLFFFFPKSSIRVWGKYLVRHNWVTEQQQIYLASLYSHYWHMEHRSKNINQMFKWNESEKHVWSQESWANAHS